MKPIIDFGVYAQSEIKVGKIVEATVPEGSNKLLQFTVDFGPSAGSGSNEIRMIFSGIKEWYNPEDLVGVKTIWVTNIPPKKTPFGESNGMLFACDDSDGKPYIVRLPDEVPLGSEFH